MTNTTTSIPVTYINKIEIGDVVLTIIGSSLSIIGAFVIFITFYLWRKRGNHIDEPRKYLLFLTVADLFIALGYLWGVARFMRSEDNRNEHVIACHTVKEPGCIAQSFVTTLFSMSSFFWTTLIAFHLFWNYGDSTRHTVSCTNKVVYHVAAWGIPLAITIAAVSIDALGSDLSAGSGAWCWISSCLSQKERTIWMTVSGKGWEILMYFSCCAFYLLIKWRKVKRRQRINSRTALCLNINEDEPKKEDIRFLLLWLVEVALRMFGTIRFLMATVQRHTARTVTGYDSVDDVLLHFQSFGDSAQAFCSCLLFCIFDKETRNMIKNTVTCRYDEYEDIRPAKSEIESYL